MKPQISKITLVCLFLTSISPITHANYLKLYEIMRLGAFIIALSYFYFSFEGMSRRSSHKSFIAVFVGLLYMFILAQFETNFPSILFTPSLSWGILLFSFAFFLPTIHKSRKSGCCRIGFVHPYDEIVLIISVIFIFFFFASSYRIQSPDFLKIAKLSGFILVYFFITRFHILTDFQYTKNSILVFLFTLIYVLFQAFWQLSQLYILNAQKNSFIESGHYLMAAEKYIELFKKNKDTNQLREYSYNEILSEIEGINYPHEYEKDYLRGRVFLASGYFINAEMAFTRVLHTLPSTEIILTESVLVKLGISFLCQQKWRNSFENSDKALLVMPESTELWLQRSISSSKLKQFEKTEASLRQFITLLKNNNELHFSNNQFQKINQVLPDRYIEYLRFLTLRDMQLITDYIKFRLYFPNQEIPKTGVLLPTSLLVRSAGYLQGKATIIVGNAEEISLSRGYNIAIVSPESGKLESFKCFDTASQVSASKMMLDWIQDIPTGHIVVATVYDEASSRLDEFGIMALKKFGANSDLRGKYRWAHYAIGVMGAQLGSAIEQISPTSVEIFIPQGNLHQDFFESSTTEKVKILNKIAQVNNDTTVYISSVDTEGYIGLFFPNK